jgi:hypothetical protein
MTAATSLLNEYVGTLHELRTRHWKPTSAVPIDVLPWMSPKLWIRRHDRDPNPSS